MPEIREQLYNVKKCYRPGVPTAEWPKKPQAVEAVDVIYEPTAPTGANKTLRQVAFIWNVIVTCLVCILFLPVTILVHSIFNTWLLTFFLAFPIVWTVYLSIASHGVLQGTRPNTTRFALMNFVFMAFVSGILLFAAQRDE